MRLDAGEFAVQWAAAWNRLDIEAVLAHFDDAVVFTSPVAVAVVGVPTLHGKAALRDYWLKALSKIQGLEFIVSRAVWDGGLRQLAIVYDREVNGKRDRAIELLRFGEAGLVVSGEVFYGVQPL